MPARLLQLASAAALLGWGMIHLFWDVPYRSFLWSESLLGWLVQGLGGSWESYAANGIVDSAIQAFIRTAGVFLLVAGGFCLFLRPRSLRWSLPAGAALLFAVALLFWKESGYQLGQLIERSAQFGAPLLLYLAVFTGIRARHLQQLTKIVVALTFLGHGMYAAGHYPVPGHFIDLVIQILGTSEAHARSLLQLAGALDVGVAVLLFVPRADRFAAAYAVIWGLLTTMARPVAALSTGSGLEAAAYALMEALYRIPHASLPLALLANRVGRRGPAAPATGLLEPADERREVHARAGPYHGESRSCD